MGDDTNEALREAQRIEKGRIVDISNSAPTTDAPAVVSRFASQWVHGIRNYRDIDVYTRSIAEVAHHPVCEYVKDSIEPNPRISVIRRWLGVWAGQFRDAMFGPRDHISDAPEYRPAEITYDDVRATSNLTTLNTHSRRIKEYVRHAMQVIKDIDTDHKLTRVFIRICQNAETIPSTPVISLPCCMYNFKYPGSKAHDDESKTTDEISVMFIPILVAEDGHPKFARNVADPAGFIAIPGNIGVFYTSSGGMTTGAVHDSFLPILAIRTACTDVVNMGEAVFGDDGRGHGARSIYQIVFIQGTMPQFVAWHERANTQMGKDEFVQILMHGLNTMHTDRESGLVVPTTTNTKIATRRGTTHTVDTSVYGRPWEWAVSMPFFSRKYAERSFTLSLGPAAAPPGTRPLGICEGNMVAPCAPTILSPDRQLPDFAGDLSHESKYASTIVFTDAL